MGGGIGIFLKLATVPVSALGWVLSLTKRRPQ